ncbi:DExH-box ATP-dependent RNA helicase DExH14-like isoform X3 [Coffea arabica]|uniref:DExH-box ATP-dependent RNA helicase DExH14-like isoform X3 n=1 Tax=Coffea arabica TaxID=13443 RepID=A0ABM4U9K2_COFAR
MLLELPRLTNSLRDPFDVDQAYLHRKTILQNLKPPSSANSVQESQLARKIVYRWDDASNEVRQVYKQFIGAVVELMGGEVVSEEFQEVALSVYKLFCTQLEDVEDDQVDKIIAEKKLDLQKLFGYEVPLSKLQRVLSLVKRLFELQKKDDGTVYIPEGQDKSADDMEFGADLVFRAPTRFLVDVVLEDSDLFIEEATEIPNHGAWYELGDSATYIPSASGGNVDLEWLRDACDKIVSESISQLPRDELAMAICRVLDSEKPGDEIAGDLLDLVGDSAFEIVQDLIMHRKELLDAIHHGLFVLKSDKKASNAQSRMPSYGTQVTVQTESERQFDKLRRKEEKKHRRGTDHGVENDLSAMTFSSLLQASEKKGLFDDIIGRGDAHELPVTALPQGTIKKHYKGYEEVIIPPKPTAPMKPGEKLIEIKELDDFAQAAFHGYKTLNRIQSRIFQTTYNTNENILVCAPTGAGKTNIAMIAILHEIKHHFRDGYLHKDEFKIVYVAPMKALAAEVTSTFSHRLSPLNIIVRELTGDMQLTKNELEETQMIVTTPEKWDVITRKSSDMSLSLLVKLLIIDEVHLLNDDRGPVIEALVARTLRQVESTQSMIRIVGLSATLPNYLEVAQFLRVNTETGLFFFDSSYRPVPLAQQYIGISEHNFLARVELLNEICYNKVVDSLKQGHQAMVFVHSRKDTRKTAEKLVELARKYEDLELFRNYSHPQFELKKREVLKSRNKDVVDLFENGIGIHHAGMLRADRGLTERLFSDGLLKVLVCTATLAWGVNLPAHTVVIKGTQIYDPKAGGWRDLGMLDVMQIFGRAGRPQFDKSGEGIIITTHDKLAYYLRLLTSQLPIESQFIKSLKDNLNAEVALGTVTNVKEACAWLGYTYLFIRMKMNPLAYGIGWEEVIADPTLSMKQRALVADAARALDKAKMMRFDEKSGNIYCTELGRIASHFYIQYSSVETYNELLRQHMNESEVLRKLEEKGADLDRLQEMQEKDIGALIRYAPGGRLVKQHLGYFPSVLLSATVSPITRTVLKVDLIITPDFVWKDRFHGTALRWWILVEDSDNDHIYHSELFTLTKRMAKAEPYKLSFTVPIFEPHPPQYYIRAVSDSWLHAEAFYTISFHNLALPEGRTSHTELLDLKPLPVTALGNLTYEALYNFTHFNPIQTQAFHVLYHSNKNVLLGAPTGSGKTISAELAMLHLFNTQPDMKVIYIAPLKAIVRERMNDWRKHLVSRLGKQMVEMTGDYTPDMMALLSADIIISTPEKWDGISRNWHSRNYVKKVGLMILDEIHLLGADRGPILEVIVSRMRYISSQTEREVRFVGLSTALANAHDLADWLGVEENGLFNFKPSVRPVPLEVHIQGYPGKFYCPRMNSMNKPTYAAICTHSPTKPVLIFVSSRRQTRLTALDLIQFAASDEHPRQFLAMPEESLQMILSQVTDQNLRHTLQFGIGLHHAGLNDKDRSLVEELFANNKIRAILILVLVCTSTLAWGVNLPAHLVVIKGTEYYDGKAKRYVDFPITDILQMMGRAGRPQYDQHGKAVILVHEPKKSFYKKFLYEPFPVESSLREQLHDHINAEIVAGTICHKEDAMHYLTWTYLFRRLMVNPAYYGLDDVEPGNVSSYLSSLVQSTFEDLEDSGCIKINEDNVEPMMLGSIASQYYLRYTTVSMFGSNIGPDTSLEVFLHILSGASEYDELPVRHNEENYNDGLSRRVRYMVDKNRLDDPHVKANLLFQAHFSQLDLPISDYITDLKSVLDQSIRIIQAMIDVCANSGWLSSALTCMHLLQMVMQGLWYDKDSSLWMLPCMTDDLISSLSRRGIAKIQQLLDTPSTVLQAIADNATASRLHQDLQHLPRIRVHLKVERRNSDSNSSEISNGFNLNIRVEKTNTHHRTSRAFTPRFPKVKNEAWWLVLGDTSTSELYALKRVSFSDRLVTRMEIPSTQVNLQEMKLILVSDCYLGYEQEYPIEEIA